MRVNKDGTAYWSLGSIVEVSIHDGNHDPNTYRARCLTGGTYPQVQVLDDKYPEPLQAREIDSPFVIWREVAESEEAAREAEDREEVGMLVIVGLREGQVRICRVGEEDPVVEGLVSLEAARAWIARNACPDCGHLFIDVAGEGCTQRHIGASAGFSF